MKCPKCDYPQHCPCKSCVDRLPKGLKPWINGKDGQSATCANCGLTMSYDSWLDVSWIEFQKLKLCSHCGEDKNIRNPSGYCDHLYYPDNCEICKKRETERKVNDHE